MLIDALKNCDLKAVKAAIAADPATAMNPRAIGEAARTAFLPAMQLLVKHGADINKLYRGYRPLHALIQEDAHGVADVPNAERLESLEWVLANGADPELAAAWPAARALLVATWVGSQEYVDVLLKAGAKRDAFVDAALGDVKRVRAALPEIATARDPQGLTALHCAAASHMKTGKRAEVARLLVENGADVAVKVRSWSHDVDATYFAASSKQAEIFELLLKHGANPTEALAPAMWNAGSEFAKFGQLALDHGGDVNKADAEGQPLLNNLIRWGQFKPAFWLLEHGASPNRADARGWTAAHQAASRGNEKMMRAVIDAGADLTLRGEGGTPKEIAQSVRRFKLVAMM